MLTYVIYGKGYTSQLVLEYLANPPEEIQQEGLQIVFSQEFKPPRSLRLIEEISKTIVEKKPAMKIILDLSDLGCFETSFVKKLNSYVKASDTRLTILFPQKIFTEQQYESTSVKTPLVAESMGKARKLNQVALDSMSLFPDSIKNIVMSYFKPKSLKDLDAFDKHINGSFLQFDTCVFILEELQNEKINQDKVKSLTDAFAYVKKQVGTFFSQPPASESREINLDIQLSAAKKCMTILLGSNVDFTEGEKEVLLNENTIVGSYFKTTGINCPEFIESVLSNVPLFSLS
jgi:hypothetical protein